MPHDEKSRVPLSTAKHLLLRVQEQTLALPTGRRRMGGLVDDTPASAATGVLANRRRRFELLDMSIDEDVKRWQIVHNDSERYSVISEKFSTVRSGEGLVEYRCLLIYCELGDQLPLFKSVDDLRADDAARAGYRSGAASVVEPEIDFSDLDEQGR